MRLGLLIRSAAKRHGAHLRNGVVLVLEGSEFLELVGRPGAVRGRLLQLYEPDLAPATD